MGNGSEASAATATLLPVDEELFSGTYERTLDEKARLLVPAGAWRDAFGTDAGAKLSRWNGRLALWTRRGFQAALNETRSQERIGAMPAGAYRGLLAGTDDVAVDAAGRILLPAAARAAVGIGDKGAEVALVGMNNRVEIWARTRFDVEGVDHDAAAKVLDEFLF